MKRILTILIAVFALSLAADAQINLNPTSVTITPALARKVLFDIDWKKFEETGIIEHVAYVGIYKYDTVTRRHNIIWQHIYRGNDADVFYSNYNSETYVYGQLPNNLGVVLPKDSTVIDNSAYNKP
jgi:ABC-type microcin C transport system permease subunit YejE